MRLRSIGMFVVAGAGAISAVQAQQVIHRLDGKTVTADEANLIAVRELAKDNVTGAQLAILNHGHVVWTYAYGLRDVNGKLPMRPDTNIWAASITKGVFATWCMKLVEQGKLNLDQPIAKMLPKPLNEYEAYRLSATELVQDPQWPLVTPRMVLSHTAGFSNLASLTEPDGKMRIHFPPGSRFAYSGEGLNLLQFVLEETVLHRGLEAAMRDDLFIPLGMPSTGMSWKPEWAANNALRYGADGRFLAATRKDKARAAGNMATTVDDMVRFTTALLNGKILSVATVRQMLAPQVQIKTAHQFPTLSTETSDEGPKVGLAYGLGWGVLAKTSYGPAFFKEGHGDGAQNYMICFPNSGTCMVLLTNSDNGELAFRPLLEQLTGDNVTPWEWESYTREQILASPEHAPAQAPAKPPAK